MTLHKICYVTFHLCLFVIACADVWSGPIHRFGGVRGPGGAGRGTAPAGTHKASALLCFGGQMPRAAGLWVSEQPSACAGAERGALGQPCCWARNPRRSRLLAAIEARLPSSVIPGLQINPGPAGGPGLRTAPSGNDRPESRRMTGHGQSVGDSHVHVGLRLRHHSQKLSPLTVGELNAV